MQPRFDRRYKRGVLGTRWNGTWFFSYPPPAYEMRPALNLEQGGFRVYTELR